jgi:hypothetical protein
MSPDVNDPGFWSRNFDDLRIALSNEVKPLTEEVICF